MVGRLMDASPSPACGIRGRSLLLHVPIKTLPLKPPHHLCSRAIQSDAAGEAREEGLGVYVHWPYCARVCPYCDFNRYVVQGIDHEGMARAYLRELAFFGHFLQAAGGGPHKRRVQSVFFGGGTPSLAQVLNSLSW